jgi:hypothetical protein
MVLACAVIARNKKGNAYQKILIRQGSPDIF